MSEYSELSIDELIGVLHEMLAQDSEDGEDSDLWEMETHLIARCAARDAILDISEAMAEAGEIVVVDRDYRPFFIGSQLDEAAVEAAIDASEDLTARTNGKADECEYVQTVLVAYREASLSLANEAGVKP